MSCKNCSDVTILTGEPGNGVQTVVDNGDGTFTFFFTDGNTFTTPDFNGTPGTPGTPGAAATITVGTVTIGPPGTTPSVTNSGTSTAAVFDFVFPIGIGYGKTLWVDDQFGDDATALRDRIDLPYKTIGAAITAASADDNIHIRTSSYTEDITLKNLVNIYCDEGVVINGKITDGGNPAVSVVSGNGILQDTASTNQCIEITGNGSDVKIRLERITNTGSAIMQRATTGASSKLIVETEILSGNIQNYFVTVGGNVDCTVKINQLCETASSTGINAFVGVDARISAGAPDGFSGTLNFSCPKMIIQNGPNEDAGVALYIEHTTTDTAKVYFNVDQIINNYDKPTYNSDPNSQNAALGTLNLNGNGEYLINVKDCYSKSRVGLMVGAADAISGGSAATGTTIFEGMIFSQRSAAVRQVAFNDAANTSKLVIKNSSLMRGVDPQATAILPDRNSVVILGDSGFGTQALGGIAVDVFDYINTEFIGTQIIKNADNGIAPATAYDPSLDNAAVCVQGANSKVYFKGCDIVNGIENQTPFASSSVAGFDGVDSLDDGNANVYFKDTHSNKGLKTTPGAVLETNSDATGFIEESSARTFNYLHKA